MKHRSSLLISFFLVGILAGISRAGLPLLRADGSKIVTNDGKPVALKGCNLGNWLLLEPWMFGKSIDGKDEAEIFSVLRERFGEEKLEQLMEKFRASWISPADFEKIKSFGFNVVRLPIDYPIIQNDAPPFEIRADAFKWIDKTLDSAEAAGLYVIIDLHSAPGRQSVDGCTGAGGINQLWSNETNLKRTADIWHAIAKRYRDRNVVAAYDLLNEPYGDYRSNNREDVLGLMKRIYPAVRDVDERHLIFMPGVLGGGVDFYGDPRERGWTNVGFTEHHYAGLFGDKPAFSSHERMLTRVFPGIKADMERVGVPYYVGEFNVVLRTNGGERTMREYFDRMGQMGWAATMWSYKTVKPEGGLKPDMWCMVTNSGPLPVTKIHESSYEEFENLFDAIAKDEPAFSEPLRKALTDPNVKPLAFTKQPELPTAVPAQSGKIKDFTGADIGGALHGGESIDPDGTITMYAGGIDIWAKKDAFRFLSQPVTDGKFEMTVQVSSLLESAQWAKAGIMARWGDDPDAAMGLVNVFPNGTVAALWRSERGETAKETKIPIDGPPTQLRLVIDNGKGTAMYRRDDGGWTTLESFDVPKEKNFRAGLAANSNNLKHLTMAKFKIGEQPIAPKITGKPLDSNWTTRGGSCEVDVTTGERCKFSVEVVKEDSSGGGEIELKLESTDGNYPITLNLQTININDISADANKPTRLSVVGTPINDKVRCSIVVKPSAEGSSGSLKFSNANILQK